MRVIRGGFYVNNQALFVIIFIAVAIALFTLLMEMYRRHLTTEGKNATIARLREKLKKCPICGNDTFNFGSFPLTSTWVSFQNRRRVQVAVQCEKCGHVMSFTEP